MFVSLFVGGNDDNDKDNAKNTNNLLKGRSVYVLSNFSRVSSDQSPPCHIACIGGEFPANFGSFYPQSDDGWLFVETRKKVKMALPSLRRLGNTSNNDICLREVAIVSAFGNKGWIIPWLEALVACICRVPPEKFHSTLNVTDLSASVEISTERSGWRQCKNII